MRAIGFALCLGLVVGCGGGGSQGGDPAQEEDAGMDADLQGDANNANNANNAEEDTGGDTGGDVPPYELDAEEAISTPELDSARRLSDLTRAELQHVCTEQRRWESRFDRAHAEFWCVADALDSIYGVRESARDPALTCSRLRDPCVQILDLESQFNFPFDESNDLNVGCMFTFDDRFREVCQDPTLGEYKACLLRNAQRERAVLQSAELSCAEAVEFDSLRPDGMEECACGIPARLGDAPADDADWDFVLDAEDVCPDTPRYARASAWGCDPYQDSDFDQVWDQEDLCLATEAGAADVNPQGCSQAQDQDLDLIPNVTDPCPNTALGALLVSTGCSAAQDEDADGVPNGPDWCPFTPLGVATNRAGCTPEQGEPWNEPYLETLPENVMEVAVGEDNGPQLRFYVVPSGVHDQDQESFGYEGTLLLALEDRYLQLPSSDVTFGALGPDGRPRAMTGTTPIPFPNLGLFDFFRIGPVGLCTTTFGVGASAELQALDLPLRDERAYLAIECMAEFSADLGPIHYSIDERNFLLVIDPLDPALLARGNIDGLGIVKYIRDVAFGISNNATFPFEPTTTWGVEDQATPFGAHLYAMASAPIETPLPSQLTEITVNGELYSNLDPNQDGLAFEQGAFMDQQLGANGEIFQTLHFIPGVPMSLTWGEASMGLKVGVGQDPSSLWVSGRLGPNNLVLHNSLPLRFPAVAQGAVFLSERVRDSFLVAETQTTFQGSQIELPLFPNLFDFDFYASVRIDGEGIRLIGQLSGAVHEFINLNGEVLVEVFVGWDLREFYVELQGEITFLGDLDVSEVYLGNDDIRINGESFSPF
jgi:hypothetical protein